jgi:hypothetical protein
MGTEAYVRDAALATIRAHELRQRAVIHLANYQGPEVMQDKVNIARQTALHMVRYSCNARDVHLLRALSKRAMGEAREAHDNAIRVMTAAVLGQYQPPPLDEALQAAGSGFLHQVLDSQLPRQFVLAYPRIGMHENAGGLGLWQEKAAVR